MKNWFLLTAVKALVVLGLFAALTIGGDEGRLKHSHTIKSEPTTTTIAIPATTTTVPVRVVLQHASRGKLVRGEVNDATWWALAQCESPTNSVSRSGKYHGYFQFGDWAMRVVGMEKPAEQYTYEEQRDFAKKLLSMTSWSQWPVCSKKIGMR